MKFTALLGMTNPLQVMDRIFCVACVFSGMFGISAFAFWFMLRNLSWLSIAEEADICNVARDEARSSARHALM